MHAKRIIARLPRVTVIGKDLAKLFGIEHRPICQQLVDSIATRIGRLQDSPSTKLERHTVGENCRRRYLNIAHVAIAETIGVINQIGIATRPAQLAAS
jgi:hypothetical protein